MTDDTTYIFLTIFWTHDKYEYDTYVFVQFQMLFKKLSNISYTFDDMQNILYIWWHVVTGRENMLFKKFLY